MSFNTLTPHYEEDVIYALSAADTSRQLGLAGPDAHKVRGPYCDFWTWLLQPSFLRSLNRVRRFDNREVTRECSNGVRLLFSLSCWIIERTSRASCLSTPSRGVGPDRRAWRT